ncbi:putative phospholipid ABC transporter permease protein MlaE [Planctomycetes bacterium Poly30]|uniref:Putative phospholipid ABC transporter permease protein MlaE n=1 Tax=Saltatorellus ferox TaxID=2528018 RepID=A0A518EPC3_9BACT|nr:putative phospholipid ABC transporter permease protein MlaE [Planctomycetes bacterium Poly30]
MASVQETIDASGVRGLRLSGEFRLETAAELRREVLAAIDRGPLELIDLSGVERLEGSAASVLADALCTTGQMPEMVGARPDVRAILDLYTDSGQCPARLPAPPRVHFFDQVGASTLEIVGIVQHMLAFVAQASGAALGAVRNPRSIQWGSVLRQIERHGADGLPIVAVIGSLMGLITAFQAAVQLRKFGADSFVADLVSLSLTRELAPLMTAIVVAGRSGAAIAAEIGTMKVSEEIDALHTLGICPHRYLVFPRMLALIVALPLLTLVADMLGIFSGAVVATATLEVSFGQFVQSARAALVPSDILGGLVKAAVFGGLIAGLAAERGLSARGGAEGVGRVTTSAVVGTLFWLVLADAIFALFFNVWGLQ